MKSLNKIMNSENINTFKEFENLEGRGK